MVAYLKSESYHKPILQCLKFFSFIGMLLLIARSVDMVSAQSEENIIRPVLRRKSVCRIGNDDGSLLGVLLSEEV